MRVSKRVREQKREREKKQMRETNGRYKKILKNERHN